MIGEVLSTSFFLIFKGDTFYLLFFANALRLIFSFSLFDFDLLLDLYILNPFCAYFYLGWARKGGLWLFLLRCNFLFCKLFLTYIIFLRFY